MKKILLILMMLASVYANDYKEGCMDVLQSKNTYEAGITIGFIQGSLETWISVEKSVGLPKTLDTKSSTIEITNRMCRKYLSGKNISVFESTYEALFYY